MPVNSFTHLLSSASVAFVLTSSWTYGPLVNLCLPRPAKIINTDEFLGTWRWRAGDDTFQLTISQQGDVTIPPGVKLVLYAGRYRYSKGGRLIEESFSMAGKDLMLIGAPPFAAGNDSTLEMQYRDTTHHRQGRAVLKTDSSNPNKIRWLLQNAYETVAFNKVILPGFTLPTHMVLERVN